MRRCRAARPAAAGPASGSSRRQRRHCPARAAALHRSPLPSDQVSAPVRPQLRAWSARNGRPPPRVPAIAATEASARSSRSTAHQVRGRPPIGVRARGRKQPATRAVRASPSSARRCPTPASPRARVDRTMPESGGSVPPPVTRRWSRRRRTGGGQRAAPGRRAAAARAGSRSFRNVDSRKDVGHDLIRGQRVELCCRFQDQAMPEHRRRRALDIVRHEVIAA